MKRALVCGAGGFIGHHLTKYLKNKGYWVRGVDQKYQEFEKSPADEFIILDLRDRKKCTAALLNHNIHQNEFDEVYQLAADMGGMGFIHNEECDIVYNSALINLNMADAAIRSNQVPRYLFASSACVYRDQTIGEIELSEEDAYPAFPHNEYGWEKLYAERVAMTFGRHYNTEVRIARFQNTFGPLSAWTGGREKAPAALCRKIAEARDGDTIDVWGTGTAMRAYTYVEDLVDGIYHLMHSDIEGGVNIGIKEYVSVNELVYRIAEIAKKDIEIKHINGPVGVNARYFTDDKIRSTGWVPNYSLDDGLKITYNWINEQIINQIEGELCLEHQRK